MGEGVEEGGRVGGGGRGGVVNNDGYIQVGKIDPSPTLEGSINKIYFLAACFGKYL